MYRSSAFLILIIVSLTGYAAEPCSDAYQRGGMVAWEVCQADLASSSRSDLERVYAELINKLVDPKYLEDSQLQWRVYAEEHCEFIATGAQGGSGESAILSQCENRMFKERAQELKGYLECHGMGCPPLKP